MAARGVSKKRNAKAIRAFDEFVSYGPVRMSNAPASPAAICAAEALAETVNRNGGKIIDGPHDMQIPSDANGVRVFHVLEHSLRDIKAQASAESPRQWTLNKRAFLAGMSHIRVIGTCLTVGQFACEIPMLPDAPLDEMHLRGNCAGLLAFAVAHSKPLTNQYRALYLLCVVRDLLLLYLHMHPLEKPTDKFVAIFDTLYEGGLPTELLAGCVRNENGSLVITA